MDLEALKGLAQSMKEPTETAEVEEVETEEKEEISAENTDNKVEDAEDSSLKEESLKEGGEDKVEEEESQPTKTNIDDKAKEESEKESDVKSYTQEELDELIKDRIEDAKLDWEEEKPKDEYVPSEYVKGIIDADKKGYKVDNSDFWKFQTEDFDKTAQTAVGNKSVGMDLIADAMQISDPDAPHDELMEELSLRYRDMLSGDYEPEDPEYKKAELAYNRDVRKSARDLKKLQGELKLPQNPEIAQRISEEEEIKKIEAAKPKAERQFKRKVGKFFENNKSYSFKYGGNDFEYEFSKEELADLSKEVNSIFENVPQLVTPEGLNDSLVKEELFSVRLNELVWNNESIKEKLITKAVEHKAAQKLEEDVKERKNTQTPKASGSKTEKAVKSDYKKLAEQMRKSNAYR